MPFILTCQQFASHVWVYYFLHQACQGAFSDPGAKEAVDAITQHGDTLPRIDQIPEESDIFVGYASAPGILMPPHTVDPIASLICILYI